MRQAIRYGGCMTRYELDEETGMIWMLPGHSTDKEAMDVLGKALCMNTARLARACGVPENEVYECKKGSTAAITHNLQKVHIGLRVMPPYINPDKFLNIQLVVV